MAQTVPTRHSDYFDDIDTHEPRKLFDVTCVIGSVYADTDGQFPPTVAAYIMIAEHDAPGHYTFPKEDGTTVHVVVDHEPTTQS